MWADARSTATRTATRCDRHERVERVTPLQLAWHVRRRLYALLGVRTRGVKLLVENAAGEVLLVRHSYGKSWHWVLPGGGVGRREPPDAAARRELREGLGCSAERLALIGTYVSALEGRRDTIHLFRATTSDPLRPDGREIAEAGFFARDGLPQDTSPATRRRIAEVFQGMPLGPNW